MFMATPVPGSLGVMILPARGRQRQFSTLMNPQGGITCTGLSFLPLSASGSWSSASWNLAHVRSNSGCAAFSFSSCATTCPDETPQLHISRILPLV